MKQSADGRLTVHAGAVCLGEYVSDDVEVGRPFWRTLRNLDGVQLTRNMPPIEGQDPTDHPAFHPGVWLAYGDVSGGDFWRGPDRIAHVRFVQEPAAGEDGASFVVENHFVLAATGQAILRETCTWSFRATQHGVWLTLRADYEPLDAAVTFGDQEEMGLGLRVATPLAVDRGGEIVDSAGRRNGDQVWGQTALWCDYRGVVDGRLAGILLAPHPDNPRPTRYHARDYGLLVANPFAEQAFGAAEPQATVVAPGQRLQLRFGLLLHGGPAEAFAPADAYAEYLAAEQGAE